MKLVNNKLGWGRGEYDGPVWGRVVRQGRDKIAPEVHYQIWLTGTSRVFDRLLAFRHQLRAMLVTGDRS